MTTLLSVAHEFFSSDGWSFDENREQGVIHCRFRGQNGAFNLVVQALEDDRQVIAYVFCPNNVQAEQCLEVAEFVTRANYGLKIGNFELDLSDGEVRYKSSIDVEGGEANRIMIKNLVVTAIMMMDRYYPGLMALLYGGKSPEEAVEMIERPMFERDERLFGT